MADVFEVAIPVEWIGVPYWSGSHPIAWLAIDGSVTEDAAKALRLTFRLHPTGRDEAQIQRNIDAVNGGLRKTVDLDMAIGQLWTVMLQEYEAQLWPGKEGRPKAATVEEAREQDRLINQLYQLDQNRAQLERMEALRKRSRALAEWPVLLQTPADHVERLLKGQVCPCALCVHDWRDVSVRAMPVVHQDAVVEAYNHAKAEAEERLGKARRSGP